MNTTVVTFSTEGLIGTKGIRISADGRFELIGAPEGAEIQQAEIVNYYQGQSKKRVFQRRFPLGGNLNLWEVFSLKGYDKIYVIDTNYKRGELFDGDEVAISCFFDFEIKFFEKEAIVNEKNKPLEFFEMRNPQHDPEKIGWYMLCSGIVGNGLNLNKKIAIITDHDCGKLDRYNSRKIPIVGDLFLPENIQLHYARDNNKASFNKFIKICHNQANVLKKHIRDSRHIYKHQPIAAVSPFLSHYKYWRKDAVLELGGTIKAPTVLDGTIEMYGRK